MLQLGHPWALLLLLPLAGTAWAVYRRRRGPALLFSALHRIPQGGITWRVRLLPVASGLLLVGLALLIVALARPRQAFSRTWLHTDSIAIMMVADVSGSMNALDFSTGETLRSRMDVVKDTLEAFVGRRPNDLVGLITFGGYAATRVPLTLDHDALRHALRAVEIAREIVDADGRVINAEEMLTAIGDALAVGTARLRQTDIKSRVMVLLSDGESNTGVVPPLEAAAAARAFGIRVYTIGIGSTGRAPFRGRDRFGREAIGYAEVTLDEALLRRIAEITGGVYFNVRDPKGLERAMEEVDRLEKTRVTSATYHRYREYFPWFLHAGLVFFALGAIWNAAWTGRLA